MIIERLKSGVITVGQGGGFVVEGAGERLVITAAHCLPSLPPALPSFGLEARTYGPLLARRGEEPRAWAVCRFVDPIADIAVLGSPDNPHADDYTALMWTATALSFGNPAPAPGEFLGTGPAAVARRPVVRLHHPPLRRAAVDHPRRRARPRRNVGLADRRGGRDGDRGRVHHHVAQGGRS
jgi:hypothetical protein